MSEERINYLITKYGRSYVPGEKQSGKTNKVHKRNQRKLIKHSICEELLAECDFLDLSKAQKDFVHFLINRFGDNFKRLHGKAKNEAIILAFIFYVVKLEDSRISIDNYSVCKKYGFSNEVFLLIVCRMCDSFIRSSPILYYETRKYDHDILSRNGGEL